jgi:hypothetical protein
MLHITWNLPRHEVKRLWREALKDAVHVLTSQTAPLGLLSCHLILYGGRRDEFYSPADPSVLCGTDPPATPTSILLLLDDIYDMFGRLTVPRQLFDFTDRIPRHLSQVWDDEGNDGAEDFSDLLRARLSLEWRLAVLAHLLSWRHAETLVAEALADQLDARFLAWGVKQLAEAAAQWLSTPASKSVYLSHPVSRPRREKRKSADGTWPQIVKEFNELQKKLLTHGLICVMPTAIDEYRIAVEETPPLHRRLPRLDGRWPPPLEQPGGLLHTDPGPHIDIEQFQQPDDPPLDSIADIGLRTLENQITIQVSSRDHLLVSYTGAMLVFRPFYLRPEFSSGVRAEISHWTDLARGDRTRRAGFVHFLKDVKRLPEWKGESEFGTQSLEQQVDQVVARSIGERCGIPMPRATEALAALRQGRPLTGVLDKGIPPPITDLKGALPDIERSSRCRVMQLRLTGIPNNEDRVGIWIVEDQADLREHFKEIAKFLRGESAQPTGWEAWIDRLWGNSRT